MIKKTDIVVRKITPLAFLPVADSSYGVEFLGTNLTETTFSVLLVLQAFVLLILLILYRQQLKLTRLLKAESQTDYLTNIPNRRHFYELLESNIAMAARHNQPLTILSLDLDFFKGINDTYGHAAGDKVLQKVTSSLKNAIRINDCVGRLGGEEFGVQLPMTDVKSAKMMAMRLRKSIELLNFDEISLDLQVTCSIGIATYVPGMTPEKLCKISDDAMYAAKESGRNCIVELTADDATQPGTTVQLLQNQL